MSFRRAILVWIIATWSIVAGLAGPGVASAATPVVVYPGHLGTWSFHKFDGSFNATTAGTAEMVNGPATPPLGRGSAHLATAANMGDGSAQIGTSGYDGTKLSSLTSLTYWAYETSNNGQQFPYLALCLNMEGTSSTPDDFLIFEPPYQTPATGNPSLPNQGPTKSATWQEWNAYEGGWWDGTYGGSGGASVGSLAGFIALHPNATIADSSQCVASGAAGGIGLQVGYGSPSDNFDGNVDAVTIGVSGTDTTYDFELALDQANTSTAAVSPISGDYLTTYYGSVSNYYLGRVYDTDGDANTLAGWKFTVNWGDSTSTTCAGGSTARFCGNTGFPTLNSSTYPSGNPDLEVVCQPNGAFCDLYGGHHYTAAGRYSITITSSESSGSDADGDVGATAPAIDETLYYDVYVSGGTSACAGVSNSNCVSSDFTTQSATEGAGKAYNVAYVTDGGAPTSLSATVAWGDGSTSNVLPGPCMNGCYVKAAHTFAEEGVYKATAVVTDSSQSPAATGSNACPASADERSTCTPTSITIYDAALSNSGGNQLTSTTPTATSSGTCNLLAPCAGIVATFRDLNAQCNGEGEAISAVDGSPHYVIHVTYGDGSSSQAPTAVTQRGSTCVFDVSGSHVYAVPGNYTVAVAIVDEGCTVQPPPTAVPGCMTVIRSTVIVSVPAGTVPAPRYINAFSNRSNPGYYVNLLCVGSMGCPGGSYRAYLDYRDFGLSKFFINRYGVSGGAVFGPGIMAPRPESCSNQFPNSPYCTLVIDVTVRTAPGHATIYGHYVNSGQIYYFALQITSGAVYTGSFQITANSPAGVYTGPAVPVTARVM